MPRCLPRPLLIPLATLTIALALVSCTRSPAPQGASADDANEPTPPAPSSTVPDDPEPTLEEQALEVWEAFHTERHAQLTNDDDPDATRFEQYATGQGADTAVDLIILGRGEVPFTIVEAEFWPTAHISAGADQATISDCILVAERPASRPGAEPTVKSQVWTGTLVATDAGWLVDEVSPGVDNCVAPELNRQLLDAYAAYHQARNAAWDPPTPENPLLVETMTGARLENFQALLAEHLDEGIVVRDLHDPLENAVVFELGIRQVTVSDCHPADSEYGAYDLETGERLDDVIPPVEPAQLNLVSVDLVQLEDDIWKVAESAGLDKANCTPQGTDYVVAP